MKLLRSLLITALAAAAALAAEAAIAQTASSGPGAMRCTVVIGRLSSRDGAERMPVLTWVQGYLSGVASARTALDKASVLEVPEYDALQPQILALCRANPTANLYHVASNFSSAVAGAR
ncbi:MAG: HdeA/HdeB family chaperone [Vitreoscilla sp.]